MFVLITGCSDSVENAKEVVKEYAVNKHDVIYRGVKAYPGDVVCGEFDSFTAWGESNGYNRFIVYKDSALITPSSEEWSIFCTANSAEALFAVYGIGPVGEENANLEKIHKDLKDLDKALSLHLEHFGSYPQQRTGADLKNLLTTKAGGENKEAEYLSNFPNDPWGRDYYYKKIRTLHGTKHRYRLYTLGKDGVVGGSGVDADISIEHLKYLDHIKSL